MAFEVLPTGGPNDESTAQLVRDIRALESAGHVRQTGRRRSRKRQHRRLGQDRRSAPDLPRGRRRPVPDHPDRRSSARLLVPVVATGGFILSLLATYGLLVAVFQWGWFASVFGIHSTGPVLNFLPIILVGILFGLAMDYQLFLASGMREAYVHGAAGTRGRDARIPGGPDGRHRRRDHHDRDFQRLHLLGLGVHRRARPRARLRRPRRRVRGAPAADAGGHAPARRSAWWIPSGSTASCRTSTSRAHSSNECITRCSNRVASVRRCPPAQSVNSASSDSRSRTRRSRDVAGSSWKVSSVGSEVAKKSIFAGASRKLVT